MVQFGGGAIPEARGGRFKGVLLVSEARSSRPHPPPLLSGRERRGAQGEDGWTAAWLWDDNLGNMLWEVASSPAVVGLMRELCGPNVCLWAGGLATKAPAHGRQDDSNTIPFHQDAPYAAAATALLVCSLTPSIC